MYSILYILLANSKNTLDSGCNFGIYLSNSIDESNFTKWIIGHFVTTITL